MDFQIGNKYKVKVVKIIKVGAIVELEDGTTELIHLSNVSNQYVSRIDDFISVGDTYEATCQEGKTKPTELTLRPLNLTCKVNELHSTFRRDKCHSKCDETKITEISNSHVTESNNSNLDRMIACMNQDFEDKMRSKRKNRYDNKKKYKHRKEDY